MTYDYLVVGAGFAGSTLAERLASQCGHSVLVVDSRGHVGGNAYDELDEHGIRIHRYGPHIFHTSSERVVRYLSQFTAWRPYEHRVLSHVEGRDVAMPICARTIAALYGLDLDPAQMTAFFDERREKLPEIRNSEDAIVARVGREIYELLFAGYTRKQWGIDARDLDASVCGRIPIRTDRDDRYFSDSFQAMPLEGFASMFERMLAHPKIDVVLGTRFEDVADRVRFDRIIYTGRRRTLPAYRRRQLSGPGTLHARQRIQTHHGSGTSAHHDRARVSARRGRSVLPDSTRGKPRALRALRGAGRGGEARDVRRSPRRISLLQHGSGRRIGARRVRSARHRTRRLGTRVTSRAARSRATVRRSFHSSRRT